MDKDNGRRSQGERSAATRERLLEATFDCLVERGYGRTSTPEILKRCGMSRGAMLHHYPTKTDLVTAAVDYVLQRQLGEFQSAFRDLSEDADRASTAIEMLWRSMSGPSYYAWLELVMASRHDEVLREKIREVTARFGEYVIRIYEESFPRTGRLDDFYTSIPPFAFAVINGMAIANIYEDEGRVRRGVDSLKQLASFVDRLYRDGDPIRGGESEDSQARGGQDR